MEKTLIINISKSYNINIIDTDDFHIRISLYKGHAAFIHSPLEFFTKNELLFQKSESEGDSSQATNNGPDQHFISEDIYYSRKFRPDYIQKRESIDSQIIYHIPHCLEDPNENDLLLIIELVKFEEPSKETSQAQISPSKEKRDSAEKVQRAH